MINPAQLRLRSCRQRLQLLRIGAVVVAPSDNSGGA
jgi:hypothetical protein